MPRQRPQRSQPASLPGADRRRGRDGQRAPLVLASPIILYDFPGGRAANRRQRLRRNRDRRDAAPLRLESAAERARRSACDRSARALDRRTGRAVRSPSLRARACRRADAQHGPRAGSLRVDRRAGARLRLRRRNEGRQRFDRAAASQAPRRRVGYVLGRQDRDGARDPPGRRGRTLRRGHRRRRSGQRSARMVWPFVSSIPTRSNRWRLAR